MIKPGEKDINPIKSYGSKDFENWLRVGFEGLFLDGPSKDSAPFAPLHLFIDLDEDYTTDLEAIYDALPAPAKGEFRQGLADALSHLPPERHYVKIFRELLLLGGAIYAYEILDVLPAKVGNGFFGLAGNRDAREIFITALDVVAAMATPDQAQLTLRNLQILVNSRFFLSEYADTAFIALCRADSKGFPVHLKALRNHINNVLNSEVISF